MKKLKSSIGVGAFWVSWPLQFGYFKLHPQRSRVLVVTEENEFLAVRPLLGSGEYMLPGGGPKRHETLQASAVRELREETGINVPESSLKLLGTRKHSEHGIPYRATHYVLQLPEKPPIRRARLEIMDASWLPVDEPEGIKLMTEVNYALKRYKPLKQTELL